MPNTIKIVYTTINNQQQAFDLAKRAVTEKVAACVNVLPQLKSFYMWQGMLQEESEFLILFKTAYNGNRIKTWLKQNHPYDVPAIIELEASASEDFQQFIEENSQCHRDY